MAVGAILFALALSPLNVLEQFSRTASDRLLLAMMMFQQQHRFLTFCATIGGVAAILERTSLVRVLLTLTSSFMLGYLIGQATFGRM